MYVEKTVPTLVSSKTTESVYIFRQDHHLLDEFGAAQKLGALPSIGPPNDRGDEIETILNKSAFFTRYPSSLWNKRLKVANYEKY